MPIDYKRESLLNKQYYLNRIRTLYEQPATKASISLILSLLTISFFGLFAIQPTLTTIAKIIKRIKDQQVVDQSLAQKIKDLNKAQAAYLAIEPSIPLIDKFLPKNPQFVRFTQELKFLSFKNGLLITDFSYDEFNLFGKKSDKQIPINFKITVIGQYQSLKDFLTELIKLDRLLEVDAVDFSTESDTRESLEIEVLGKVFYLPD